MSERSPRLISLSNVYDQHYHEVRGEPIERCLSWGKRRDLFACLERATGRELLVLSSPPKTSARRSLRWLPALETRFSTHRQLFCPNLDGPKVRIPSSWLFYARHVLRSTRAGDVVFVDNYELIYIIAAWVVRLFRRRITFVLDYEDGKHLIDKSWWRLLSGLAEFIGRPLFRGALLAHPALGRRLPLSVPTELVPGFIGAQRKTRSAPEPGETTRFLYSGSLDSARGVPILLETLHLLPDKGWRLDVTGDGPLRKDVARAAGLPELKGKVFYHGPLATPEFESLINQCHVGLNCQRGDDPVSGVTFPSKIFTYLSAGLVVISSKASEVETICGNACLYYAADTPAALATVMEVLINNVSVALHGLDTTGVAEKYSIDGTAARLKSFLAQLSL